MKTNKLTDLERRIDVYQCHPNDTVADKDGVRYSVYNTMSDFSGKFFIDVPGDFRRCITLSGAKTLEEAKEELKEMLNEIDCEKFHVFFEGSYGKGATMTITTEDGNTISGLMYGNDECFNVNEFYQVLVSGGKVYECYYQIPNDDDDGDLSNIDYEHPYRVDDCTGKYEDAI